MIADEKLVEGRYILFVDKNRAYRVGRIIKVRPRKGTFVVGKYNPATDRYGDQFFREEIEPRLVRDALTMRRRSSARRMTIETDALPDIAEDEPILEAPEVIADAAREDA